jgi:Uma2 family endonuclease
MSAAGAGVRELQQSDISLRLTEKGGHVFMSGVPLPAVFHSEHLQNNEEFARFCGENSPLRFERYPKGEVLVMAPAFARTGQLELYTGSMLHLWAEKVGTGIVFGSTAGFEFPDTSVLSPDASWVATDRWNALTREQQEDYAPLCPEFVIEIRFASDRVKQLEAKMRLWLHHGAQLAWMIDPKRKLAMIYRPDREPEILKEPATLIGEGIVAGFELEMKRFWA